MTEPPRLSTEIWKVALQVLMVLGGCAAIISIAAGLVLWLGIGGGRSCSTAW